MTANHRPSLPLTSSLYWLALVMLLGLAAFMVPAVHASNTRLVVRKTDAHVRAAQACERNLDRDRAPHPTRRLYARSESMPFRHWAYGLWRGRSVRCQAQVSFLNAYPPRAIRYVFSRIGQESIALTVAEREGGGGYCTRAWNPAGYAGCFQMGQWARDRYGHGSTALEQSWAAYFYVRDARGWCSGWAATAPGC